MKIYQKEIDLTQKILKNSLYGQAGFLRGQTKYSYDIPKFRHPNPKEVRKLNLKIVNILPGEELCTNCRGTGILVYCTKKRFRRTSLIICTCCRGKGKHDWIDAAMNKKGSLIDIRV